MSNEIKENPTREFLMIDAGAEITTKWGKFLSTKARANAWICANCGFTPYVDALNSKADVGIHKDGCMGDDYFDDCSCNENDVPLVFWGPTGDNPEWQIDICMPCAQKLHILDDMIKTSELE